METKNLLLIIIPILTIIVILASVLLFFLLRSSSLQSKLEKYETKIDNLLTLPFKNKLVKLEKIKNKNLKYIKKYSEIEKNFINFQDKIIKSFLDDIEILKKNYSKKVQWKFPCEDFEKLDKRFNDIVKYGLRLINELNRLTYPESLQNQVYSNIQEIFSDIEKHYSEYKKLLSPYSQQFDQWLHSIRQKFKLYSGKSNDETSEFSIAKKSLIEIVNEMNRFVVKVNAFLKLQIIIKKYISVNAKKLKILIQDKRVLLKSYENDINLLGNEVKDELKQVAKYTLENDSIMIEVAIFELLFKFIKYESFINKIVDGNRLINQLSPIRDYWYEIETKQFELLEKLKTITKNQIEIPIKIKDVVTNLKHEQEKLNEIQDLIKRSKQQQKLNKKEGTFTLITKTKQFIDHAQKYQQNFKEILDFVDLNLENYSRLEKVLSSINSLLVEVENDINSFKIKLQPEIIEKYENVKARFNKIIQFKKKGNLIINKEIKQTINGLYIDTNELVEILGRQLKALILCESSIMTLNKYKDIHENLSMEIDKIKEQYELGNYFIALSNISKVVDIYKMKY